MKTIVHVPSNVSPPVLNCTTKFWTMLTLPLRKLFLPFLTTGNPKKRYLILRWLIVGKILLETSIYCLTTKVLKAASYQLMTTSLNLRGNSTITTPLTLLLFSVL